MVNQEVLGGLKVALERGETLERAMNTFYNSGYAKKEIEQAARALRDEESSSGSDKKVVSNYMDQKRGSPDMNKFGANTIGGERVSSYRGKQMEFERPRRKKSRLEKMLVAAAVVLGVMLFLLVVIVLFL